MNDSGSLSVRELLLEQIDVRINYFHNASDDYLRRLGVDRARLPQPEVWRASYEQDYARSIEQRQNFAVAWELNGTLVGFSSVDRIVFGHEAFMHLHVLEPDLRRTGLGAQFVPLSIRVYFDVLKLERLFSEPNAFNTAPNRALQRGGFRYLYTHETIPGPLNFLQPVTRWVIRNPDAESQ